MQPVVTPGSSGKITAPSGQLIPIGALARRTGCNIETIRFYEKIGVLPKPPRTESGRRAYGHDHAERLTFVRRARELGFTLDEVRTLLTLADTKDVPCAEAKDVAVVHLAGVHAKIADLLAMQKALASLVARCEERHEPGCPLIEALARSP